MSYGRNRLPVPYDDRITDLMVRGLPDNIPDRAIPRINIDESVERDLPLIAGVTLKVLQDNYGRNPLRNFLYNLCADNTFDNETWDKLVASVAEVFVFLLDTVNRGDPQDLLEEAANRVCDFMSAKQMDHFRELEDALEDKVYSGAKDNIARGAELARDMEDWKRDSRGRGRGRGRDDRDDRRGSRDRGRGDDRGFSRDRDRDRGSYRGNGRDDYADDRRAVGLGRSRERDDRDDGGASRVVRGGLAGVVAESNERQRERQPETTSRAGGSYQWSSTREKAPASDFQPVNHDAPVKDEDELHIGSGGATYSVQDAVPANSGGVRLMENLRNRQQTTPVADRKETSMHGDNENLNPERMYDRIELDDGSTIVPAFLSEWRKTFVLGEPEHLAYDTNTHILFHRKDKDGVVTNVLKEITPEMDYLRHEANAKLAAKHSLTEERAKGRTASPDYGLLVSMKPVNRSVMSSAPAGEVVTKVVEGDTAGQQLDGLVMQTTFDSQDDLSDVTVALSLASGIAMHDASVNLEEVEGASEYYVDVVTPYVTLNQLSGVLSDVTGSENVGVAMKKLLKLLDNQVVPEHIWHQLNDVVTERLNSYVLYDMGIRARVSSAAHDYDGLAKGILDRYGATATNNLNGKVAEILGAVLDVLTGEELADFVNREFGGVEEMGDKQVLALTRRHSVTYLPFTNDQMGINLKDGGTILQSATPELYTAMTRLIERTDIVGGVFAHRYLVTSDNVVFDLRKGFFNATHLHLVPVKGNVLA